MQSRNVGGLPHWANPTQVPPLAYCAATNTGLEGVWHFDSGARGLRLVVTAPVRRDELCGAWALQQFLESGLRPRRGSLTIGFCNLAGDEPLDPRATELQPFLERADRVLCLRCVSDPNAAPVLLTGPHRTNIEFALELGARYTVVVDGSAQVDDGSLCEPQDGRARALTVRCGHHADSGSCCVAMDMVARFLVASGSVARADIPPRWWQAIQ